MFGPLGIVVKKPIYLTNKKEHMAFHKGHKDSGWVSDPQGIQTGGWGLTLRTQDVTKIGQLCLNQGLWQNQQLISRQWIKDSTKCHSHWHEYGYGYLWWVIDEGTGCYGVIGDSGTILYIDESRQLVIAMTTFFNPRSQDSLALIRNELTKVI